ncbi:MAG: EAL domain-containing protein [Lachnospiraceae bacterium]|nr:EAL domain-containing protein [Lachnospiraceae bacterium]
MANTKQKKIRKLKKNHSWVSLIVFVFLIFLIGSLLTVVLESMVDYVIESKISSEYQSVFNMAELYGRKDTMFSDEKNLYDMFDEEGRDYFIKDSKGNIIHSRGKNTCTNEGGKVVLSNDIKDAYLYKDSVHGYITVNAAGKIMVDLRSLYKLLSNITPEEIKNGEYDDFVGNADSIDLNAYNETDNQSFSITVNGIGDEDVVGEDITGDDDGVYIGSVVSASNQIYFKIPAWAVVNLKDGSKLYAKVIMKIDMHDMSLVGVFLAVIVVLTFILFVIVLVTVINGIVRQRRMFKVFFTDIIIDGHNWMWFLYKGEALLRKGSSAKKNYAVLNFVFVKYRNYCVCHTVEQGEKVLKKVYTLIQKNLVRKEMLAHVSNSNFAVLMKYEDEDKLKMRIQSLILELEKIDPEHVFSFQVGVDLLPVLHNEKGRVVRRKNIDIEVEYNNACTARATLADGDESGVAFFDQKLIEDQLWLDKVTEKQRFALEHEEFLVFYQPKYDPKTDELRGAEALIRWQSPELGFIPPGRFIPIFEKNGFITEIDHYMLEHVAKDQKAWLDKGCKCVPVSVNISRAHFIENDLAEQIRDTVDKVGTPHNLIEIELTESAFFDDKKAIVSTIVKLKNYGFSVSMDDFGSGYSSLNSLKDMPLDVLKLDAEFFRGENAGERGEIVVAEAIKLAKNLNMRIVAEGVEVKEQVDFLAKQDCDMIQGYYYAKPMPKNDFEQRM